MALLKLSDTELDTVFAAARPLAVQDRDPFLRDVAERLAALPHFGDGIVHRAHRQLAQNPPRSPTCA
jgi:hypothetical protein